MNLTLLTYFIYSAITAFIILRVGWVFYRNGAHYLHDIFTNDYNLAENVNRLLLVGYYLLNLGYVAVSIAFFDEIEGWVDLTERIAQRTSYIVLSLGLLHYGNMAWVHLLKMYIDNTAPNTLHHAKENQPPR
ncbi:MAG: hypothetical protein RLP15_00435 [Cryomorphaceae bacterium]